MREIQCACGHAVTTPFCPECGRRRAGPLAGLYRHVAGVAASQEKGIANRREAIAALEPKYRESATQALQSSEARAAEWRGWADALRDVLDAQEPEDGAE